MNDLPPSRSDQHPLRILSLEDEPRDAELIQAALRATGMAFAFHRVDTDAEYVAALESNEFDLVLADFALPETDGITALRFCHERRPELPFIFVSGSLGEEVAIETMRQGAADYVLKDRLDRLPLAVERAVREARERAARRSAEKSLRESEAKFRALFETAREGIFLMDEQRLLSCNLQALSMFGCAEQDIIGHLPVGFSPDAQPDGSSSSERAHELIRLAFSGQAQLFEWRHQRLDGTMFATEVSLNRIEVGGKPCLQAIVRDITERKQAEDRIRQQAALLEASRDAILVWDLAEGVQFMNRAAEELTGKSFAEARSQHLSAVLRVRSGLAMRAAIQEVTTRGNWSGELALMAGNDKPIEVASRWTALADTHGKAASILITCNDITEKKRLEAQYLRAQRLESVGTLASGVAHDLNNILAPLLMGVEMLSADCQDEETRTILNMMKDSACRGADTVKQLLTFARGGDSQKGPVQPRHLLKEIAHLLQQTLPKNIQIYTDYAERPAAVLADPSQLHQVLMNLCVNARDAMPNGGVLFITLENKTLDESAASIHAKARPIPYVVFKVSDSGTGIPPEVLDRIFDPFFTTKPQGKGTGLGLATVLGIVESHGGFVLVESKQGEGTTFQVFIPASGPAEGAGVGEEIASAPLGQGEVILIVDDEAAILHLAGEIARRGGYTPLKANSASEALSLHERNCGRLRAVLTDIMMPFGDGRQLITMLYEHDPKLPIIAMSGLATAEFQREAMTRGATAFLRKPFTAKELLRVLGLALNQTRS